VTKLDGWRWRLPLALLLGFTEITILIFVPLTSAKIINALVASDWRSFRRHLFTLALLTLSQILISFAHRYALLLIDERTGRGLRQSVIDTVLHKEFSFFEKHWVGDIVSRTVNDTGALQVFTTRIGLQLIYDSVTLAIVIVILIRMNPVLGVLTIATAPITLIYGRLVRSRLEAATLQLRQNIAGMTGHLQSWLSRPLAIKLHALEPKVLQRLIVKNDELAASAVRSGFLAAGIGSISSALLSIPTLLIFAYGGYTTLNGGLSIGELFAFMTFTSYFNAPIQRLISIVVSALSTLYPVYDRVSEFLADGAVEPVLKSTATPPVARLEVRDLRFSFVSKPDNYLAVPSFIARKGEVVGLTGPNGSGKSTLARLLIGIYPVQEGEIIFETEAGGKYPPTERRRLFACVPQAPTLFDGTLLENVTLFEAQPDQAKLAQLEQELELSAWIASLPQGWQTEINAGLATTFSGGQIQKIGLARLLYRDAPVLLFDEPGTNLDAELRPALQRLITTARPNQIVIVISHSPDTLALCQRVYSLRPVAGAAAAYTCELSSSNEEGARLTADVPRNNSDEETPELFSSEVYS
jgi:ABC-type bacteriocin/lantibiotic exporter with double-glycine peptidase domain